MKFIAFDLESPTLLSNDNEWATKAPLGIAMATMADMEFEVTAWLPREIKRRYSLKLDIDELLEFAGDLLDYASDGYKIMTWNGLGYDFRLLCSELHHINEYEFEKDIMALAYSNQHYNLAYQMVAEMGFMCKLDNALKGMKLPQKTTGVSGSDVASLWLGVHDQQEIAIDYGMNDAIITKLLYDAVICHKRLRYYTNSGDVYVWHMPHGLLDVVATSELPELPKPYWTRNRFDGWLSCKWRNYWVQALGEDAIAMAESKIIACPSPGAAIEMYLTNFAILGYYTMAVRYVNYEADMTRDEVLKLRPNIEQEASELDKHHAWMTV